MNLGMIWQALVGSVTSEVHRVEQAFTGTAGAGPQKKTEVLGVIDGLLDAFGTIFPGIPKPAVHEAASVLIDAVVAVSNTVGYFQHGGAAPDRGGHG